MFVFILIGYSVLYLSEASDILTTLWDTDVPLVDVFFRKHPSPNDENIIIRSLSKVPFTEILKHDVWVKLANEYRVEKFKPEEWNKFESLIPDLPVSVLEKVNVSDDSIMSYFGHFKLRKTQLKKLAEKVSLHDPNILEDKEKLYKMGNIVCGFSSKGMQNIKEPVLRSLMNTNFFEKIKSCDSEQLRDLLKTMAKHTVIGPPRTWQPDTVKQAGILISALTVPEIREIQERSFSQITPEVIESIPVELLKSVRDSQLKTLSRSALLSWRRKTHDLRSLQ